MFAATKGYLDLIDTIMKNNTNMNLKDSLGRNALFYTILAATGDNADIVSLLIEKGTNPNEIENSEGNTALMIATKRDLKGTIKCLLEHNADPNIQNFQGNTALHIAILNNPTSLDIINLLINHKANLEAINKENLNTLDLCVKLNKTNIYEILAVEKNSRELKEKSIVKELEHDNVTNSKIPKKKIAKPQEINSSNNVSDVVKDTKDQLGKDQLGKGNNVSPKNIISSTNFGLPGAQIINMQNIDNPINSISSQLSPNIQNSFPTNNLINNNTKFKTQNSNNEYMNTDPFKNNNFNNQTQNINININNMSLKSRNINSFKPQRSKLCKKNFSNGDKPYVQNRNDSSNIEIPFNFNNKFSNGSQMHTYISKLYIEIKYRNEESTDIKH